MTDRATASAGDTFAEEDALQDAVMAGETGCIAGEGAPLPGDPGAHLAE